MAGVLLPYPPSRYALRGISLDACLRQAGLCSICGGKIFPLSQAKRDPAHANEALERENLS